jgi:hypothetical protein
MVASAHEQCEEDLDPPEHKSEERKQSYLRRLLTAEHYNTTAMENRDSFAVGRQQVWVKWFSSSSENIKLNKKAQKAFRFIPNINPFISQVGTQITYFSASYFFKK